MSTNDRILQIRFDALSAEYIYTRLLSKISHRSTLINALTILVPILFSSAILITKGTDNEKLFNNISIVIGAILLALIVWSLIAKLDQKRENYIIGRRLNISIASEALKLLEKDCSDTELQWFYSYIVEMDSKDAENIGEISNKLSQEANRYALKKQIPGSKDVVCKFCNASPFTYKKPCFFKCKKNTCQVCGNIAI